MALSASRGVRPKKFSSLDLAAKNEATWKGGVACLDRSTGLVAKAFTSVNLVPIGFFADDKAAAANKVVTVDLFREIWAQWMPNSGSDPVVVGDIGGLCYLVDDATVAHSDATNTLSVAGMVWAVDSVKGVLVEFRELDSRLGGLDA